MNITALEPILLFLNINAGLLTLMKERNCETVKRMTFSPLPAEKRCLLSTLDLVTQSPLQPALQWFFSLYLPLLSSFASSRTNEKFLKWSID